MSATATQPGINRAQLDNLTYWIWSSLTSPTLSSPPGERIKSVFSMLGTFFQADRVYALRSFMFTEMLGITHEWCDEGVYPHRANLEKINPLSLPWFSEKIKSKDFLSMIVFPPEAVEDRRLLGKEDVQSIVFVPMAYGYITVGFLGFDTIQTQTSFFENNSEALKHIARAVCLFFLNLAAEEGL